MKIFEQMGAIVLLILAIAFTVAAFLIEPIAGIISIVVFAYPLYMRLSIAFQDFNVGHTIEKESVLVSSRVDNKLAEITKTANDGVLAALSPNGTDFYISDSDRACVIGPPGTGKTTFLVNQIKHWIKSERAFVCLDIKPEIYSITRKYLEEAGYKVIIFNPAVAEKDKKNYDYEFDSYDFFSDIHSDSALSEFVSSLITSSQGGDNIVFEENARNILYAYLLHVKTINPNITFLDAYDELVGFSSLADILAVLKNSSNVIVQRIARDLKKIADNERLIGSIFAVLSAKLDFLKTESSLKALERGFSLDVLQHKRVAIFLQFEEARKDQLQHLMSVFVGHLLRYLIENSKDREAVLCLFDEIGNASVISSLPEKLNTIRSRKIPVWLYWQSKEQMQMYGQKADEGPSIIMGACDYQLIFRLNDNTTAEWFSDKIGKHWVTNRSAGHSYSPDSGNTYSSNQSWQEDLIIKPHELQQLAMSQVVSMYRGISWISIAEPFYVAEANQLQRENDAKALADRQKKEADEREARAKKRAENIAKTRIFVNDTSAKIAKNTVNVTKATIDKAVELTEDKPKDFEDHTITQTVADNLKKKSNSVLKKIQGTYKK